MAGKKLRTLIVTVTLAVSMVGVLGPAAHADRCEPEELLLGSGSSPIDERDHPACWLLLNYVYPQVCNDYTSLMRCSETIDPNPHNPGYTPYSPNLGRIMCNTVAFITGSPSC